MRISEVFLSLQGEGPSAGTPAHFIRLQGCDVGCIWCDTKYTWDSAGGREAAIGPVLDEALALGEAPLLVITGGEPLEHPNVVALIGRALERWPRVEIETSGVLPPPLSNPRLAWNVSPKLASVTTRADATWQHAALWLGEPNATFKIVIAGDADLTDAAARLAHHAIPAARVMFMPEGLTDDVLRERARWLAEACKRLGVRMSPRLHIWMWGARRGV